MWVAGLTGALCIVSAVVAVSCAGRASGSAKAARSAAGRAEIEALDARLSSRSARSVSGVDWSYNRGDAAEVDVSERIRQDLVVAGATAQRINYRARFARTAGHRLPDVFVKTTP